MHPVIEVNVTSVNGKPQYELKLSRANFNYLCAGCPESDRLIGSAKNGVNFYIFENTRGEISKSFRPLHSGNGYYVRVGATVPNIPFRVTSEEFEMLALEAYDNLEKAINESGVIPIEDETSFGTINLGYVVMKIEKKSS